MKEAEFSKKYKNEIPIFQAWGDYVNKEITDSLVKEFGGKKEVDLFLKVPPKPRVKDLNSIISKAFYRNKNYKDPYKEITDKVGVRYVVLLKADIKLICDFIDNSNKWVCSKDKDFEKEKSENPTTFNYQSIHYIVKNKYRKSFAKTVIPVETPCEIQIRTLLQHAYSELTHDTIYKPKTQASPDIIRSVSKSMALIEVTDDIFGQVTMTLKSHQGKPNDFLANLRDLYNSIVVADYEEKVNVFILDAFKDELRNIQISDVATVALDKIVIDTIKRKYGNSLIYRQPIVLFIYYLILEKRNLCKTLWPLTDDELRPLFSDLGVAFDGIN